MLKNTFIDLIANYTKDESLMKELWTEIEKSYSSKSRHYHNLEHLKSLLKELNDVKGKIDNWNCLLFTLFYHDAVYNARRSDNEEKSAELAIKRMKQISVDTETIERCKLQIEVTKTHVKSEDTDANYFTDADLSILGRDWATYTTYTENVRKEYSIYPDLVYKPGRKKVLQHFLSMDRIFKTDYFHKKFEAQAKENLQRELLSL